MNNLLSVIICTHNPRWDYLSKVFESLKAQSLARDQWELIIVDNRSDRPVNKDWDISWHPCSHFLSEEKLGLTHARIRGISAANSELVIFVDDDNLLAPDYLLRTLEISIEYPFLGVWGGSISGQFEVPPPKWIHQYLDFLAIRTVDKITWSNIKLPLYCPVGAGVCTRVAVAREYMHQCQLNRFRLTLDRRGQSLIGAGDFDLAYTACDLGFGMGLFPSLQLYHLIPNERTRLRYMERLCEDALYSLCLLEHFHGTTTSHGVPCGVKQKTFNAIRSMISSLYPEGRAHNRIRSAQHRGVWRAKHELERLK